MTTTTHPTTNSTAHGDGEILVWTEAPPAPSGPVTSSLLFGGRAILKIKHVPEQLADVIGIPILFTLLFTYLVGGALAGSTAAYLRFLLPGTLVLALVFVTIYSGATLNGDLGTGAFDRFRSMPIWRPAPIVGALVGDLGRYLIAAAIVLGIGFVILFPLTFVSNVFVEPRTMPAWLHTVADANPITHLTTAARDLMGGTAAAPDILWTLVAAVTITLVFAPLTMYLYRRR